MKPTPTPIRRHESLKALSREHHHGLLLSWKIREGLKRDIETGRIKTYTDWFWQTHLKPHFEIEEEYVFSILPADDKLVAQAVSEHQRLEQLFLSEATPEVLNAIQELLVGHIRFEERILFARIQEIATPEQWALIEKHHNHEGVFCDNLEDEFWVK